MSKKLILIIGIIVTTVFIIYKDNEKIKPVVKSITTKYRPIAIMINNNHDAWPHCGLGDADIVYEIIVEGGITRLMAIFHDKDTTRIGSIRSARPYFLDYVLENDAIFIHHGFSDDAKEDIQNLKIDSINGLYDSSAFWRDNNLNKSLEHTVFTSMEKIKQTAKEKGYLRDTNKEDALKYKDNIKLKGKSANNIYIKYSSYTDTSYEYDSVNKVYKRSMSSISHTDCETNIQYTAVNIIILKVNNYSYDNEGRQKLENIGTGDGYYITRGNMVEITWEKKGRNSKTIYKNKETSKEIEVNKGNTYIQIIPINGVFIIE